MSRSNDFPLSLAESRGIVAFEIINNLFSFFFFNSIVGPMFSSGMCTQVFQFDVSSTSVAIIPAPPATNVSAEHSKNSTDTHRRERTEETRRHIQFITKLGSCSKIKVWRTKSSVQLCMSSKQAHMPDDHCFGLSLVVSPETATSRLGVVATPSASASPDSLNGM